MKSNFLATMLLIAAILSFPACKEENSNLLPFNVSDVKAGDNFQSSEFLNDLLAGRILEMEYIIRSNSNDYGAMETVYRYTLVEDEFTKPNEVWFHFTNGSISLRYKLERCLISNGVKAIMFEPIWAAPDVFGDPFVIDGWREITSPRFILTENAGIVFKFDDCRYKKLYGLRSVYTKLSDKTMLGGDWMLVDEEKSIHPFVTSYISDNLFDVMEMAYKEVTVDAIQKEYAKQALELDFKIPFDFKITRK